ncbi:carboxypeptidase-like regulatory domain-containing protein [Flagellimonas alvinocaridis]|uniref:Carboxypeptidase-like regulatory domain-containing protein n=1 Tax=Flagellimonas alvinocaridis TaxID=2530200 RepID=A0A4V4HX83_9FLAO|nr:carboxypeptidase-like regulatory domain-containing protein [Allomuricauda alvinocaridis]THV60056.1 carboxypeptidase-like regulatory domain-containing protein [Allomuricauda alvinocaridis]
MTLSNTKIFPVLLFLMALPMTAQTISSRLVDAKTQKGIPYATVQYGEHQGTITNDEGRFSFTLEATSAPDSIYISSMGYAKQGFALAQLQDSVVLLQPKAIELSGVYVFDKELTVDEIIEKMVERLPQNINKEPVKQRFFLRQSELATITKVDFGFEESSIPELNKGLMDSIAASIPKNAKTYTESLGDLYKHNGTYKLDIIKAADLYDKNQVGSFEELGERMQTIFTQNIKPDSYLKIKSGIFSQKVQVDSILSEMAEEEAQNLQDEVEKDTISGLVDAQRSAFKELLNELYYQEDSKLDLTRKTRKYAFTLAGYAEMDDAGVYVIDYEPKRGSAEFKGRLYINISDFAIMRLDVQNTERLRNFRLLGITYREVLYKGTMRFAQLPNGKYDLRFMDFTFGRYFAVDRPLKVIEKNKHVKGRRKQNELSLNIDFRMSPTQKWELVVFDQEVVPEARFTNFKEDKTARATYMPTYDPGFWQGHTIMEPNQAIREFTVEE